jgi:hypothetical protein
MFNNKVNFAMTNIDEAAVAVGLQIIPLRKVNPTLQSPWARAGVT